jgi:cytochrome c553
MSASTWTLIVILALVWLASWAIPTHAGPLDTPGYAKAVTCAACHGAHGNSRSDSMPILAGANVAYFKKAIEDYAAGRRASAEMEPLAKQVKLLGVDEVAAYFAVQKREPTPVKPDRAAVDRGRAASSACVRCHGNEGQGDAPKLIPAITGQPAGYLRNQLLLFKADKRSPGDPALTQLKSVLKGIPDETLADIAAYYSSLK